MYSRIHLILMALFLTLFVVSVVASAAYGDAADLVSQGDRLTQMKQYSEAVAYYDNAISLERNNFNAWNGKSDALNRAGDFMDALAASDTALALEPSSAAGWINRGYILYNLGKYDDELMAYETAISYDPGNADAWFNKGYSLAGLKRYDEAIKAFDRVKELQPDYPKLEANRRIAEQLRDAGIPFHIRHAPFIVMVGIILVAIAGYSIYWYKSRQTAENAGGDNRQRRRQKKRKMN